MIDKEYSGEFKIGLFGEKQHVGLKLSPESIEAYCFVRWQGGPGAGIQGNNNVVLRKDTYDRIISVYIDSFHGARSLAIDVKCEILTSGKQTLFIPGITDVSEWKDAILSAQKKYIKYLEDEEKRNAELQIQQKNEAITFFDKCFTYHIKEKTPKYYFYEEDINISLLYLDDNKSLNFLKIDGNNMEEYCGTITYDKIHYYEKAGSISYVSEINGKYESFGGSFTGGSVSKLASVGGGLLFGAMGMATGALMTHKPASMTPINTTMDFKSEITSIDSRSVILNFYSDAKKQYIDIELPHDIYNFLQTYLPEKKYSIVDDSERQKYSDTRNVKQDNNIDTDSFKQKIDKLKYMRDSELLSDEEFEKERKKLLESI